MGKGRKTADPSGISMSNHTRSTALSLLSPQFLLIFRRERKRKKGGERNRRRDVPCHFVVHPRSATGSAGIPHDFFHRQERGEEGRRKRREKFQRVSFVVIATCFKLPVAIRYHCHLGHLDDLYLRVRKERKKEGVKGNKVSMERLRSIRIRSGNFRNASKCPSLRHEPRYRIEKKKKRGEGGRGRGGGGGGYSISRFLS